METRNVDGDEEPREEEEGELLEQDLALEHRRLPHQEAIVIITGLVQMPTANEGVQSGDACVKAGSSDRPTQTERDHRQHVVHGRIVDGSTEEEEEGGEESEEKEDSAELQFDQVLGDIVDVHDGFDETDHCNTRRNAKDEEQRGADRPPAGIGELVVILVSGFDFQLQRDARYSESMDERDYGIRQNGENHERKIVDERFQKAVVDFQPVGESSRPHQTDVQPDL